MVFLVMVMVMLEVEVEVGGVGEVEVEVDGRWVWRLDGARLQPASLVPDSSQLTLDFFQTFAVK
jgi:hypothetical protein